MPKRKERERFWRSSSSSLYRRWLNASAESQPEKSETLTRATSSHPNLTPGVLLVVVAHPFAA
jgi:hypothetical protein